MDFDAIESLNEEEIEQLYYIAGCWCNKTPNTYYYDSKPMNNCRFNVMGIYDCPILCSTRPDEWRFARWHGGQIDSYPFCYCDHLGKDVSGAWGRVNCPLG